MGEQEKRCLEDGRVLWHRKGFSTTDSFEATAFRQMGGMVMM